MKKARLTLSLLFPAIFSMLMPLVSGAQSPAQSWPQWRGPVGNGIALKGNPPVEFSETKNLKWKTAIPGKGHATPLVWGDKIILQTAVATNEKSPNAAKPAQEGTQNRMSGSNTEFIHEFKVIVVDRNTGKIIWEKTVAKEWPSENTHELGSWASNSPCTDGEHIYAFFGSRGVFCLDFAGNILWQKDYGQMEIVANFGEGASPVLYKDRLFIQWDHQKDSWMIALDKKTGNEIWKFKREEITSWATPIVVEVAGKPQVITAATNQVRSYDYETGEVIWSATGLTRNVIPNPVYGDGILYVMSGFRGTALMAIDLAKAKGDITGTPAILWTYNQDTPYTPQPVLMDGKLYFLRANNGFLTCLDAKTGKVHYASQKLEGISTLFSSPTGVGNRLYIAAKNIVLVLKAGSEFGVLASNQLNDNFHASPVIVDNELFLRGFENLYCFSE